MTANNTGPILSLVPSFSFADFPEKIIVNVEYDPKKYWADYITAYDGEAKERKMKIFPPFIMAEMRRIMKSADPSSYRIEQIGPKIYAGFNNYDDKIRVMTRLCEVSPEIAPNLDEILDEHYPFFHCEDLHKHWDPGERDMAVRKFRRAAAIAGIADYEIKSSNGEVRLHLRTRDASDRIGIALRDDFPCAVPLIRAPKELPVKELKRIKKELQSLANAEFTKKSAIAVGLSPKDHIIFTVAKDAYSLLRFHDLLKDNWPSITSSPQIALKPISPP